MCDHKGCKKAGKPFKFYARNCLVSQFDLCASHGLRAGKLHMDRNKKLNKKFGQYYWYEQS